MNGIGCKTTATSGGDAFIVLVTEPISRGLPPPAPLPPLPLPPPPVPSVDPYKTRPRKPTRKERTAFVVLPELPPPPPADMANPNTSCSGRVSPFRAYGFKTPEAGRSRASSPRPLRRQVSDSQIVAKKKKTAAVSSLSDVTRRLSASSKDLTVLSNKSKSSAASKSKASTPKPARKVLPTARKPPVSPTRATKTPLPSRTPKTPQPQKTALPPKTPLPSKKPQPPKTAKPPLSPSGPTASKSPTKPKTTASTHGTPNCSSPAKMSNKSPRLSKKPIVNGSPAKLEYVPGDTIGGTTTTAATVAENITTEAVTGGSTTTTTATTAAAASASISVVAPVAIDPETVTRITVTPVTATPPVVVVTQSTAVTNSDPVITQTTAAAVALPSTRITSTVTPAVPPPIGDPPVRPSVLLLPQDATVATKADVNRPKLPPAIKPSAVASTPALSYQMKGIKIDAESLNQSGGRAGMSTFMATRKMSISNGHKTVAWARPSEKIIVPEPKEEPSGYRRFANRLCCAMKCCPAKCNRKTCVCHCAVASKCWAAVWKRRPRLCESSAAAAEEGTGGWWSRLCRCCCCRCKRNKASLSENSELGESTDDLPPLTFFSKLKNRLGGLCCCCAAVATCFRRCCCCTGGQAKRGDVPKKLAHRKRPPFRCTGCCTNIPKLDAVFVDHSSVMRGAIPVLPLTLAWICLVFNVILPGAGTFSSGVFCLCVGKPRFTVNDTFQSRLGSLLVNAIVAASQLFTVLFCLVGWGWSVWWGVIMIKMAKKYQKVKLMDQPAATETPASVEQNHRDLI